MFQRKKITVEIRKDLECDVNENTVYQNNDGHEKTMILKTYTWVDKNISNPYQFIY